MATTGVGGGFIPHLGVVLYPRPDAKDITLENQWYQTGTYQPSWKPLIPALPPCTAKWYKCVDLCDAPARVICYCAQLMKIVWLISEVTLQASILLMCHCQLVYFVICQFAVWVFCLQRVPPRLVSEKLQSLAFMKYKPVHSAVSMVTTLYRGCIANFPHRPSPILNNSQYAPSASQPFTTKHNPPQSSTDPNTLCHPSRSPRLNPITQCTLMDSFLRWQSPRPHCKCDCQEKKWTKLLSVA